MIGRPKNRGKVLLRRSTSHQEKSLSQQLDWAIAKAREVGAELDASEADLAHMQANGLHRFKDLYVDTITGADLDRPGLKGLRGDAMADRSISHLFIYLPDRFARPKEPFEAALMEIDLRKAGITIEFSNRTAVPRRRGTNNFADDVQLLYQYTEAGQYLNNLAQRVIEGQVHCAELGAHTGGRAPYGFTRVLVDASGVIIQELLDGMRVRKEGCRVRLKPGDPDKIRIWVMILEWYFKEKLGTKKIAQRLNDLGFPSPDACRSRTDNGIKHKVSGRWSARTVLTLIRNRAIIGLNSYGVQSEGKYRRLGQRGPRLLEDADTRDGEAKVVQNDASIVISRPIGFGPSVDVELFQACQEQLEQRGQRQRGISRRRDPARYPLALRVWDMSAGCGHPMYAMTSGQRVLYKCGRYMKTAGAECEHNAVDGDAALAFVMNVLTQQVERLGGRDALRARLVSLAAADKQPSDNGDRLEIQRLEQRVADAETDLKLIGRNLARAKDEVESDIIRAEWLKQKSEMDGAQRSLDDARRRHSKQEQSDPAAQVELALSLYDEFQNVVKDDAAKAAIPGFLEKINLRLWLSFGAGVKGTRKVRVLQGGILTTGDAEPPIRPYGDDNYGGVHVHGRIGPGMVPVAPGVNETPSVSSFSQPEGVSFTMVNRGDKI